MSAIDVMRKALEALEPRCGTNADERQPDGAITALRAELERMEAVEPVAWAVMNGVQRVSAHLTSFGASDDRDRRQLSNELSGNLAAHWVAPLYTAPIAPATSEQKPKAGETWHVLRAGAVTCATLTISEITQSTVLFAPTSYTGKGERVPLGRGLQFIERASSPIAPAIPALTANDIDRAAGTSDGFFAGARWAYALAAERAGVQIKDPLQELADDARQIGLEY